MGPLEDIGPPHPHKEYGTPKKPWDLHKHSPHPPKKVMNHPKNWDTPKKIWDPQKTLPPLSLTQTAPFLKKEGTQDRQQPGTETETDCPFVSFMELFLQSTVPLSLSFVA